MGVEHRSSPRKNSRVRFRSSNNPHAIVDGVRGWVGNATVATWLSEAYSTGYWQLLTLSTKVNKIQTSVFLLQSACLQLHDSICFALRLLHQFHFGYLLCDWSRELLTVLEQKSPFHPTSLCLWITFTRISIAKLVKWLQWHTVAWAFDNCSSL